MTDEGWRMEDWRWEIGDGRSEMGGGSVQSSVVGVSEIDDANFSHCVVDINNERKGSFDKAAEWAPLAVRLGKVGRLVRCRGEALQSPQEPLAIRTVEGTPKRNGLFVKKNLVFHDSRRRSSSS